MSTCRDGDRRFRLRGGPIATLAVLVALSLAGFAASAADTPLDQLVRDIQSRYREVRTLRAAFTQTYQWGGTTRVERGTAYFARGGLMRWDYREPK